jgi:hypothetical protein
MRASSNVFKSPTAYNGHLAEFERLGPPQLL